MSAPSEVPPLRNLSAIEAYGKVWGRASSGLPIPATLGAALTPEEWIQSRLWILTKAGERKLFCPTKIQRRLDTILAESISHPPPTGSRICILKGRQVMATTWSATRIFERCVRTPNVNGLVLTDSAETLGAVWRMHQIFYNSLPDSEKPATFYSNKREFTFKPPLNSSLSAQIGVGYAGTGQTLQILHITELAKWKSADETMGALMPTVPKMPQSLVIVESTANGQTGDGQYFYELCRDAMEGMPGYHFEFCPWFDVDDYTLPVEGDLDPLDDEEAALREAYRLTDGQLAWRRYVIDGDEFRGDVERFRQEYPSNSQEAFRKIEGVRVFSANKCFVNLHRCTDPLDIGDLRWDRGHSPRLNSSGSATNREDLKAIFVPNPGGNLRIWHYPPPKTGNYPNRFCIGADVAEGVEGGDLSVARVLDRYERRMCATWVGQMDASVFGEQLALLALFYRAICAPERNAMGAATLAKLADILPGGLIWSAKRFASGWPWSWASPDDDRFGWLTAPGNGGSRVFMIESMGDVIRGDGWTDQDREAWTDIMGVIRAPSGSPRLTGHDYAAATCITAGVDRTLPPVQGPRKRAEKDGYDFREPDPYTISGPLARSFRGKKAAMKTFVSRPVKRKVWT